VPFNHVQLHNFPVEEVFAVFLVDSFFGFLKNTFSPSFDLDTLSLDLVPRLAREMML
jgi:hypothetical protein